MDRKSIIEREYRDMDGYWIDLRSGWVLPGEWTHSIVEDTKRAARARIKDVVPCQCKDCLAS